MEKDQAFLEFVVKSLVDHPDEVKISRKVDEMGVLLTLDVNKEDMGKVIGRSGNTAKAIRTLLRVVGMKYGARVNLKINEPEGAAADSAEMADTSTEAASTSASDSETAAETSTPETSMDEVENVIDDLKEEMK